MVRLVLDVLRGDDTHDRFAFEEVATEDADIERELLAFVGHLSPHIDEFVDSLDFAAEALHVLDDRLEEVEEVCLGLRRNALKNRVALR